ncbi:CotO family spore coat protein [Oceanobacillus iheyensis]|uniref:Spore coat protein CotO n=1 Tax=Oceanobacillus iheyensis (strain DSM 14371 / CIP 107618 / JCM 11309 / KCTC 3954 / HTE831) TaxID=221109 RepID=Q8ERS5_OCEIH|nr:CotO family spore coat protein [Oceanobacillus iheyensis]BAC13181.1 hypothetical protein [Oceanobacillus iheyensis HTE831]
MSKSEYAKEPLLYIHQPDLNQPKATMQHHFMGNRNRSAHSKNEIKDSLIPRKTRSGKQIKEFTNKEVQNQENHEDNKKKKQFKAMSINEKIDYFLDRSEYAPPINCLVITDQKKYRGIILDTTKEEVKFRPSNRKNSIKITYDVIKDIQLVGF